MAINAYRYSQINTSLEYKIPDINTYIPEPTELEYQAGYIKRYFIQKANDSTSYVYEISKDSYTNFVNSPFFKNISLDWVIKGNAEDIRKMNSKSIKYASEKLPSITLYLPNLLQFAKLD